LNRRAAPARPSRTIASRRRAGSVKQAGKCKHKRFFHFMSFPVQVKTLFIMERFLKKSTKLVVFKKTGLIFPGKSWYKVI